MSSIQPYISNLIHISQHLPMFTILRGMANYSLPPTAPPFPTLDPLDLIRDLNVKQFLRAWDHNMIEFNGVWEIEAVSELLLSKGN